MKWICNILVNKYAQHSSTIFSVLSTAATVPGEVWAFSTTGGTPLRKGELQLDFVIDTVEPCRISDPANPF